MLGKREAAPDLLVGRQHTWEEVRDQLLRPSMAAEHLAHLEAALGPERHDGEAWVRAERAQLEQLAGGNYWMGVKLWKVLQSSHEADAQAAHPPSAALTMESTAAETQAWIRGLFSHDTTALAAVADAYERQQLLPNGDMLFASLELGEEQLEQELAKQFGSASIARKIMLRLQDAQRAAQGAAAGGAAAAEGEAHVAAAAAAVPGGAPAMAGVEAAVPAEALAAAVPGGGPAAAAAAAGPGVAQAAAEAMPAAAAAAAAAAEAVPAEEYEQAPALQQAAAAASIGDSPQVGAAPAGSAAQPAPPAHGPGAAVEQHAATPASQQLTSAVAANAGAATAENDASSPAGLQQQQQDQPAASSASLRQRLPADVPAAGPDPKPAAAPAPQQPAPQLHQAAAPAASAGLLQPDAAVALAEAAASRPRRQRRQAAPRLTKAERRIVATTKRKVAELRRQAEAARANCDADVAAKVEAGDFAVLEAGAAESGGLRRMEMVDAKGNARVVVVPSTSALAKGTVIKVTGALISKADYDEAEVPQEQQDFQHDLDSGDVLDASDPAKSCLLRYILRSASDASKYCQDSVGLCGLSNMPSSLLGQLAAEPGAAPAAVGWCVNPTSPAGSFLVLGPQVPGGDVPGGLSSAQLVKGPKDKFSNWVQLESAAAGAGQPTQIGVPVMLDSGTNSLELPSTVLTAYYAAVKTAAAAAPGVRWVMSDPPTLSAATPDAALAAVPPLTLNLQGGAAVEISTLAIVTVVTVPGTGVVVSATGLEPTSAGDHSILGLPAFVGRFLSVNNATRTATFSGLLGAGGCATLDMAHPPKPRPPKCLHRDRHCHKCHPKHPSRCIACKPGFKLNRKHSCVRKRHPSSKN